MRGAEPITGFIGSTKVRSKQQKYITPTFGINKKKLNTDGHGTMGDAASPRMVQTHVVSEDGPNCDVIIDIT
jgi:hypothetical protein